MFSKVISAVFVLEVLLLLLEMKGHLSGGTSRALVEGYLPVASELALCGRCWRSWNTRSPHHHHRPRSSECPPSALAAGLINVCLLQEGWRSPRRLIRGLSSGGPAPCPSPRPLCVPRAANAAPLLALGDGCARSHTRTSLCNTPSLSRISTMRLTYYGMSGHHAVVLCAAAACCGRGVYFCVDRRSVCSS